MKLNLQTFDIGIEYNSSFNTKGVEVDDIKRLEFEIHQRKRIINNIFPLI